MQFFGAAGVFFDEAKKFHRNGRDPFRACENRADPISLGERGGKFESQQGLLNEGSHVFLGHGAQFEIQPREIFGELAPCWERAGLGGVIQSEHQPQIG